MTKLQATFGVWLATVVSATLLAGAQAGVTVEEFGESIALALESGDDDRFTDAVDKETLVDRVLVGIEGNDEFVAGMREGLKEALSRVGRILVNNLGPDARLKSLRARTVDGDTRVLVRLDMGDRGLNYIEFFVHRRPDGSWAIFDWVDYAQGQTYTQSLRMVVALMVRSDTGLLGRLLGLPRVDRELADQIGEMGTLGQRGEWSEWLRIYRTLPEKVRNSRVLLTTRVAAASASGDEDEYMSAMADLYSHYGDDPTLSLALVDYHLLRGDHDRAYQAIDLVTAHTGGDAALTNLRSGIALDQGDNAGAIRYARQAISEDADYENPYWNLMVAGSRAGDYGTAMEGVRVLETRFGYEFSEDELMESEEFSGLLASQEWKSREGS